MRLVDRDPRWIMLDGVRVGFAFRSPIREDNFWQTCFPVPPGPNRRDQWDIAQEAIGDERAIIQGCNREHRWTIAGGIEAATFETMTVTPSLDGSAGGAWHGFITNGEIVGGL